MLGQPWWWWVAMVVGGITFFAVVADFITEKRTIPKYIIALASVAFVVGAIKGWIWFEKVSDAIGVACVWAFFVLITWASGTGFDFTIRGRKKNQNKPDSDTLFENHREN